MKALEILVLTRFIRHTSAALFSILWTIAASPATSNNDRSIVEVDAPVSDLLQGYLGWIHNHRQAIPNSGYKSRPNPPYQIKMPSMDVYSPAGVSIYYGNSPEGNARAIQNLPQLLSQAKDIAERQLRPTMPEAFAMFPELKPYWSELTGSTNTRSFCSPIPINRNAGLKMQRNSNSSRA